MATQRPRKKASIPTREEFDEFVSSANKGVDVALARLRQTLDDFPEIWRAAGDMGLHAEAVLVSGIAGHNLCLDYFGGPSKEEAEQGLPIHGEAGISLWHNMRAEAKGPEAILGACVRELVCLLTHQCSSSVLLA